MVTPKRPLATCLMALRRQLAVGVRAVTSGVFTPFARVALAADAVHGDGQRSRGLRCVMEPSDIAPVTKRLTISLAGSTSSSGTGVAPS